MKQADTQIIRELNRIYDAVAAGSGAPAFADITGDPSDNAALGSALDAKQSEAEVQTIADAKVADTAYDATSWDGVTGIAPSKNAVRDKIESLSIPAAPSDTAYDATSWDGVTTIAPSKNAVRDKIEAVVASIPGPADIESGVYEPTLTDIANITASASAQCQYLRVGTVVTVSGKVRIDPVASAQTQLDLTLPVATAGINPENLAGTAVSVGILSDPVAIYNNGAGLARFDFVPNDIGNNFYYFTFTYKTTAA